MATSEPALLIPEINAARRSDTLRFHTSPPPSLTSRFPPGSGNPQSVSMSGDDSRDTRTFPGELKDPKGTLDRVSFICPPLRATLTKQFIEHLTSTDHANNDPNLMTIGFELEALLAIYGPDSVKLNASSRPSSFHPDYASPKKTTRHTTRDSVMWNAAMLDEEIGFSPGERIRYEISVPIWEEGEVLSGVAKEAMPDKSPMMRVMVSLPPTYPNTAPQLQLLGRYLGNFPIDTDFCELYLVRD